MSARGTPSFFFHSVTITKQHRRSEKLELGSENNGGALGEEQQAPSSPGVGLRSAVTSARGRRGGGPCRIPAANAFLGMIQFDSARIR